MTRYIVLRSPEDLNRQDKHKEIVHHLNNGCKTNEILLHMMFVGTDAVIQDVCNKFRIIKNRIALNRN